MTGVLERRRDLLRMMRDLTLRNGFFTVTDLAAAANIPRSTAQDWINRLISERCIVLREEQRGRSPARYMTTSAMVSSSCKRIFTTVDGNEVRIFHECSSSGCASFCAYHHRLAKGAIREAERDGMLLTEKATLGNFQTEIGLYPSSAVGIAGVRKEDGFIIQRIRCIGGPAYSLTDMMACAEGVCSVNVAKNGRIVEGEVKTRALTHLLIGVDDTDSQEGGATFALALGLLEILGKLEGVIPIAHHVVMLKPDFQDCTAGNSCSFIEMAVEPDLTGQVIQNALRIIEDGTLSPDWGVAVREGFLIPETLRQFSSRVRKEIVTMDETIACAKESGIQLFGGRGRIGALAGLGFLDADACAMLNPGNVLRIQDQQVRENL